MKTWGRAVATAFCFATVLAAAQVGTAAILGVLRLSGEFDADTWSARLALLSWLAISSIVAGAAAGSRGNGSGTRLSASFAAGLGGALGAGIALYPARTATLPQGDAQLMAGIALAFAAIAGFILAFGLLSARSLGWNLAVTGLLVWGLLAVAVATHPAEVRLGQLDAPGLSPSFVHSFSLWGPPVLAAVLGFLTALVARLRHHHRGAVALSGLAGPATIALAYAIAGPGASDAQKIPWIAALIAVAAGVVASLFVALPPRRTPDSPDDFDGSGPAFPLPPVSELSDTLADRRRPFVDLDDRDPVAPPR